MSEEQTVAERITGTVASWPGIEVGPHRFGGVEFWLERCEVGHLHGDRTADIPFPRRCRDHLVAAGQARPHHVLPDSGWATVPIDGHDGVVHVVEPLRISYECARGERRSPERARPGGGPVE